MKFFDRKSLLIISLLMALSSCSNHIDLEKYYYATAKQRFAKNFVDLYGKIPTEHTWSTAVERRITIKVSTDYNYSVKLFTSNPLTANNSAYLLAAYDNLKGADNLTLKFDAPQDLTSLFVLAETIDGDCLREVKLDNDGLFHAEMNEFEEAIYPYYSDMMYILAFEDLGNTEDFDFNDVVLGITHVSGRQDLKVRLLALGNLLDLKVNLQGKNLFDERMGVRSMLGLANNATMNVFSVNDTFTKEELAESKYKVDRYYNLQKTYKVSDGYSIVDGVYDFSLALDDNDEKKIVEFPQPGEAPHALLIANPDWEWPSEGTRIGKAYPNFKEWVLDPNRYPLWYTTKWDEANEDFE